MHHDLSPAPDLCIFTGGYNERGKLERRKERGGKEEREREEEERERKRKRETNRIADGNRQTLVQLLTFVFLQEVQ